MNDNFNGGTITQEHGAKTGDVAPVVDLTVASKQPVRSGAYTGTITYAMNQGASNTANAL